RLWPTALSLLVLAVSGAGVAVADTLASLAAAVWCGTAGGAVATLVSAGFFSQAKCSGLKGQLVFQTANTRCSSLRMQWPRATSPRVPLARSRLYRARIAGLWRMAERA